MCFSAESCYMRNAQCLQMQKMKKMLACCAGPCFMQPRSKQVGSQ